MNFKSQKEIWDFLINGKAVTNLNWTKSSFCYLNENGVLVNESGDESFVSFSSYENFIPYIKPKQKKKVTLYRYTYSSDKNESLFFQSNWESEDFARPDRKVFLVETKEIEVTKDIEVL